MKHIKTYKEENNIIIPADSNYNDYIPGNMYMDHNIPVCFICNNNDGSQYNLTFLIFNAKNFSFIEWTNSLKLNPLNITIKDYIIDKDVAKKTLDVLKTHYFISGPSGESLKGIKKLKDKLEKDKDIKLSVDANKYNL